MGPRAHRPHAPRYFIVDEGDFHGKSLPVLWPEGHFKVEASGGVVEVYPGDMGRCVSRAPPRARSPPLSEAEEAPRGGLCRWPLHPYSLEALPGAPPFCVGDRSGSQNLAPEYRGRGPSRSWKDSSDGRLDRPVCLQRKPRSRNSQHPLRPRVRPRLDPPLTDSDSGSAASSSDQQSSMDQYLQVTRRHGRLPRCAGNSGRRKALARRELPVDLSDLICSHV